MWHEQFDSLEDRSLCTGNVGVIINQAADTLTLIGDSSDNQVSIRMESDRDISIVGIGTTVRHLTSMRIDASHFDRPPIVIIDLNSGHDSAFVSGMFDPQVELEFFGGAGDDQLDIVGSQFCRVLATMGTGHSTFTMRGESAITGWHSRRVFSSSLVVDARESGLSENEVNISDSYFVGSAHFFGGGGVDRVLLHRNQFSAPVQLNLGAGNDRAWIEQNWILRTISIDGGDGTLDNLRYRKNGGARIPTMIVGIEGISML